jgi:hypothetical protein
MTKALKDVLERAATWPEWAQEDLAELAREIDRELQAGTYQATREELAKLDAERAAAERGGAATDEEIAAAFAKLLRE